MAIAAVRLGAAEALGIDSDPDAIQSAQDNLALNPDARRVRFDIADLSATPLPRAAVVTANLTGALLIREASPLLRALNPGGTLILSGILSIEEPDVRRAFATADIFFREQEDEWVCLTLRAAAS